MDAMEKQFGDKYPHVSNNALWNGLRGKTADDSMDYIKNIMGSFGLNKM